MKLYESAEDYLEAILVLSQRLDKVHSIDVAKHLNFTKASVSIAIHKLERNGMLTIEPDGSLILTKLGLDTAKAVYDRHLVISTALIKIGVPQEIALEDACKIEHDISKETFEALKKIVK